MKRSLLFLMAILLGLGASGQRVRHDSVAWSPSALSFDHFRGRPSLSSDGSFACFSLSMTGLNDTVGSIVIPGFQTAATMHPYRSWMLPGSCNPGRLAYHDVQFNLVELMRRHLQHDLDRGAADPDFLLDDARQALYQQLFLLDSVSDYGRDTAVVNRWNDTVTAALAAMPAAEHRGTLRHDWLFEMGFGLGMRDYRGALSDGFHDGIDFDFMLNFLWYRQMLAFDFGVGSAPLRDSVATPDGNFYLDVPASDLRLLFHYGFRLVDRNRWALTPFVGGGLHVIDQSEEDDPFSVHAGTLSAGLLFQHRLSMVFSPVSGGVERSDFDFFVKLTVDHSTFNGIIGKPSGFAIYLDLGIALGYGHYSRR
jgi:hypothetical protein